MKRRRKKKRKGRKGKHLKHQALAVVRKPGTVRLDIAPLPLEVLREHDGFLRGAAEPVIMVATFVRDESPDDKGVRFLSRRLFRFSIEDRVPSWATPEKAQKARTAKFRKNETLIVLIVACEEDGGSDIERLYTELSAVDDLVLWPLDGSSAIPGTLEAVPSMTAAGVPMRVGLCGPEGAPVDQFRLDDYIGSSVLWIEPNLRRNPEFVVPIQSPDGKNNWAAHIKLRLR